MLCFNHSKVVLFEIVLNGLLLVILHGVTEIATADSIFLLGAVSKVVVPQQKHVTSEIQNPEADDNNNMIHVQRLAIQNTRNFHTCLPKLAVRKVAYS